MKRIIKVVIALALTFVFVGCVPPQPVQVSSEGISSHVIASEPNNADVYCTDRFNSLYEAKIKAKDISDAFIEENFKRCGTTRFNAYPGESSLYILRKEGYEDAVVQLMGVDDYAKVKLQKTVITDGYLKLFSNVKNPIIYIDDIKVGAINGPTNKPFIYKSTITVTDPDTGKSFEKIVDKTMYISNIPFVKKIDTKMHVITIKSPSYQTASIKVKLSKNEVFTHIFQMEKANAKEVLSKSYSVSSGTLYLLTGHNNITATIDGVVRGLPLQLNRMATGTYNVTLSNGVKQKTVKFVIKDDEKTIIDVDNIL